jgi:predicted regulator of amino acid metabolism with ACT domain
MPYSQKVADVVYSSPKTLGNQLGRWAVHLDFPVTKIAKATNVTRQTVYNWFAGGEVFVAYQDRVRDLIKIFESSGTAEIAWRKICQHFNLRN